MFEEDAVAAMEELGHQFFVFVNAETERVAILYRRDDGDYGLIEPVVGGDYTQGRSHAPSAPERARHAALAPPDARTTGLRRVADAPRVVRCRGCFPTDDASAPTSRSAAAWSRPSTGRTRSAPARSRSSPTTRPRGAAAPRRRPSCPRSASRLVELDIAPVAIHASYLVNLAGPEEDFFERSVDVLASELRAAPGFGGRFVNVHIGSHRGAGVDGRASQRLADGLALVAGRGRPDASGRGR